VGALSFIKEGEHFPSRSLVAGNPARIIKQVSDEMIAWKTDGTSLYQSLPKEMFDSWTICEPLRTIDPNRPSQETLYKTWKEIKRP
jgi:phenylacetic acid degradation protein/carnitine operon protein CaiE